MWNALFGDWGITPPALWGKLPGHSDFVRSGVRRGEQEAWVSWLDEQDIHAGGPAAITARAGPIAFVLPPDTLAFARRRFVVGVIAPSTDRVGRHHPVVVYQQARPRWVQKHFEAQLRQPRDWQFWLTRALARHARAGGPADLKATVWTVRALWRNQRQACIATGDEAQADVHARRACALLDRGAGAAPSYDISAQLHGVRYLPWADWPQRLSGAGVESAFWQQDAQGRFVGAANRLHRLWGVAP
ncbi:type VI secretion system-associated protein TagF [Variovorax sp. H27-G14]|uniref:type VI secretion system-associated protein TagF n=1 Tax=Variovorax sp. H27-G14 TaxID=3111914 RepID=UPI0038FC0248